MVFVFVSSTAATMASMLFMQFTYQVPCQYLFLCK